jgi:hypothetical protein
VNLASRIENLNKRFGTALLISEYTYQQLQFPERFLVRYIDKVIVKGKSNEVRIFEVFNADHPSQRKLKEETMLLYREAINALEEQDKARALQRFIEIDKIMPKDLVVRSHIDALIKDGAIF